MYKVRVFLRDVYTNFGSVFQASPYMGPDSKVALFAGRISYDPYSFILNSTAPEDVFKVSVSTATALRVVCVNQEN